MNFEVYVLIGLVLVILAIFWVFRTTPDQREYDRKMKESLADEFIIDPETGAKLTLEEAESGHWLAHDNEFRTTPENQIEQLFSEEEKDGERAINYLRAQEDYRKQELSEGDVGILEKTKILGKYDEWSYSDSFRIEYCEGMVFLPAVYLSENLHSYLPDDYHESQILFWIKLELDFGHYYLREKTGIEVFLDAIRNDDQLKLKNYESFTFRKSENILSIQRILENFEGEDGLELEFMQNNLFVKNLKYVNTKDLMRIEKAIKACVNS